MLRSCSVPDHVNKTSSARLYAFGIRGMRFNIKAFWSSFSTLNSVSQSKHPRGDGSAYNQEAQLNPPILSQLFSVQIGHAGVDPSRHHHKINTLNIMFMFWSDYTITSVSQIFCIITELCHFSLSNMYLKLLASLFALCWFLRASI